MADIGTEIITYLKTKAAVTSLIGSGTAARIYLHEAKQGVALPYVVIVVYSGESHEYLSGISGLSENRVEINCYSATNAGAFALAEAIRLAPLQMYKGTIGTTAGSVRSPDNYSQEYVTPIPGDNTKRFLVSRDYFVTHLEAVA